MRHLFILVATASLLSFAGCSSSGGDDKSGDDVAVMPDANHNNPPDANTSVPDADTSGANNPTKLGKICTDDTSCPADASSCVGTMQTPRWCSPTCGTTAGTPTDTTPPPTGGDAICAAAYDGTSGTPGCALVDSTTTPGSGVWYCAVECGTYMGQDLGTCPTGLTCSDNFCD